MKETKDQYWSIFLLSLQWKEKKNHTRSDFVTLQSGLFYSKFAHDKTKNKQSSTYSKIFISGNQEINHYTKYLNNIHQYLEQRKSPNLGSSCYPSSNGHVVGQGLWETRTEIKNIPCAEPSYPPSSFQTN